MTNGTWAVVPIKDFANAKSRLASVLSSAQCGELARHMAEDVLRALTHAPSVSGVIVIGQGPEQAEIAKRFGCEYVADQPGAGLSANLNRVARQLARRGADTLLFLPADLPTLQVDDVERILVTHRSGLTKARVTQAGVTHSGITKAEVTKAEVTKTEVTKTEVTKTGITKTGITISRAARDGGTNAVLATPPDAVEFRFGSDSARRHAEAALRAGHQASSLDDEAFMRDIDTPEDLRRLCSDASSCATVDYLRKVNLINTLRAPASMQHADRAELVHLGTNMPLERLVESAGHIRDAGFGDLVTYSPKVFIPLTELCRDVCHYCTYAKTPRRVTQPYLSAEQVLAIASAGRDAGCLEALFTLGDKPELRYKAARDALTELGYSSTLDYLAAMAELVHRETGLLPHLNAGILTASDYARLRTVAPSMGMMLESASPRLSERGGPHFGSPDKQPEVRLGSIRAAGEANVPFTTGILIGIGETREERIDSLLEIRELHERFGHIQEVIIQNFVPKPGTKMAGVAAASREELQWTIAMARHTFGPNMSIQAPPNLNAERSEELIHAGINDWGGVSPVTPDHVNPESPWPELPVLRAATGRAGKRLAARLTVYPRYVDDRSRWVDAGLHGSVLRVADTQGLAREDCADADVNGAWSVGAGLSPPWRLADAAGDSRRRRSDTGLDSVIARGSSGERLAVTDVAQLFTARDDAFIKVCEAADRLREEVVGDDVTYVVNRNINYTNLCAYKCTFCAFS